MESFDPPINNANAGKSRRRLSSILKAPRTSLYLAEPERVETPVQLAMPVEKRNSRRVSFAPATDVLLFSKEKKNSSPIRGPLQDLSARNIPDNRNPIGVTAKGKHPITDMETLLNGPLQTFDQTKEVLMASRDAEGLRGEKTIMFTDDDSAMDLTHSHTVTHSHTPYRVSAAFEHDMDFTRCQTGIIEARHLNSGKHYCTANFGIMADNQWDRPLNHAEIPMDNFEVDDMEITQSQTAAIESLHGGNPLQISENIVKPTAKWNYPSNFFSPTEPAFEMDMDLTKSQTRPIEVKPLDSENLSLIHASGGSPQIFSEEARAFEIEGSEQYNCEPDDMEITKSQTVAIDARDLLALNPLQNKRGKSLAFVAKISHFPEGGICKDSLLSSTEADSEMEFTRCQTRLIETKGLSFVKTPLKTNSGKSFPTLDSNMHLPISMNADENPKSFSNGDIFPESNQENDPYALCSEDMELTRTQNCKDTGYPSLMFHKAMKSPILVKELSPGIESPSPDDLDIPCSQPIVHSTDTHGLGHAALHPSGSAGHLGVDLENRSRVEPTQHGTSTQLNQEATICDSFDVSQNEVNSSPRSVEKDSTRRADAYGPLSESASMLNRNGSELAPDIPRVSSSRGPESPGSPGVDQTSSTQTRWMSLVDLQSKLRRMSHLLHEPNERFAANDLHAPPSLCQPAMDRTVDQTRLLTALPEEHRKRCVTAPLNLNRRSLTSRLSMGNALPKLPQKMKAANPDWVGGGGQGSVEERGDRVITRPLVSDDGVNDDIPDEVLPNISSDEDLSVDTEGLQCADEDRPPLNEHYVQGASEEDVWERSPAQPSNPNGKRPYSIQGEGEDATATDKQRRVSATGASEMKHTFPEEEKCGAPTPATACSGIEAIDVSNRGRPAHLRSETTFESTLKQSMFESQIEDKDQSNDFPKKIDDDRLTVLEFFKLLNVDFVIHNPRQSIVPGKLASHLGHTPEDVLKSRHISLPKQRVYEQDHQNLAEQVERLKARMMDQGRLPLHSVNKPLWEELRCFSQDELEGFGSKMKERSNFFRKRSKAQSHEMKETLYSNLQQAFQEERQKLQGKMEEADGMLRGLNDCIQDLEAELAAVEESGQDDSGPTLKSSQRGLEKVTMEIADKERQLGELEAQKRRDMDQVTKLQTEVLDLKRHVATLHRVNEWRVGFRSADREVYSFLYGSLRMEVAFETCAAAGAEPAGERERNVLDIGFTLELDAERSDCHAVLVHSLLSEFFQSRSDWAQKYPNACWVPKLLHDVSLVVGRCRLLGEELRLLKDNGSLLLDILDLHCEGASVHLVFSSLEAMAKFELSLGVSMAYPSCPLHLQDFRNHIGSTTAQLIEEIVSSVPLGKNYLTRIVKAVHAAVLS